MVAAILDSLPTLTPSTGTAVKDRVTIMLSEKQLAERGAVIAVQELKEQIDALYKAYPGLLKAEQQAKRERTMLAKYGTLNPHEAKQKAKAAGGGTGTATEGKPKAKVSHKKGQGKKAQLAAAGAVEAAPAAAPDVQEIAPGSFPEAVAEDSYEVVETPAEAETEPVAVPG